jgi:hypothetical protein
MTLAKMVHENEEKQSMNGRSESFALKNKTVEKKGCC